MLERGDLPLGTRIVDEKGRRAVVTGRCEINPRSHVVFRIEGRDGQEHTFTSGWSLDERLGVVRLTEGDYNK